LRCADRDALFITFVLAYGTTPLKAASRPSTMALH
jgi:hypothetical protein